MRPQGQVRRNFAKRAEEKKANATIRIRRESAEPNLCGHKAKYTRSMPMQLSEFPKRARSPICAATGPSTDNYQRERSTHSGQPGGRWSSAQMAEFSRARKRRPLWTADRPKEADRPGGYSSGNFRRRHEKNATKRINNRANTRPTPDGR